MFFNRKLEEKTVAFVDALVRKYRSRPEELFDRDTENEEKQPLSGNEDFRLSVACN